MSLFPAYAGQAENAETAEKSQENDEWLKNSSFPTGVVFQENPGVSREKSDDSSDEINERLPKKRREKVKKKDGKKRRKISPEPKIPQGGQQAFVIDTTRVKEYAWVNTIARPAVPRYRVRFYLNSDRRKLKNSKKFKRYFKALIEAKNSGEKETVITKSNLNTLDVGERDENSTVTKQEEELSRKTERYNRLLAEQPRNVTVWLEYVDFQNTVYEFEKNYRKGSMAKAQRVLAERKISIIEKALHLNPNCDDLLRERIKVTTAAFPSDELQEQLGKLVDKQKDNITLWQGYIEATQCSMSHCNTPNVLGLYSKCLATLHQLRRVTALEKSQLEENILRMLYRCGLFLKQAGLLEQLWTLLRLYLELNLAPADRTKFNISSRFNETQLVELEEAVLSSQLPLHELWLRTEKLRESCHWLPFVDDEGASSCEDPQRIVFTEDVAELIHPITSEGNVFKLVATVLNLLKVPLLPCRFVTMRALGLDHVPWSLDSIESLLPSFYQLYIVDLSNEHFLNDVSRLAVGPQYLKVLPAQEEYLEFVLTTMENCANCLSGDDNTAVVVWWMRFQKLLIALDKQKRFRMPQRIKKQIKINIKNVLKKEENRTNEIFYGEYALIEYELDNVETCTRVLTTAISTNKNIGISRENWGESQINQCFLYRCLAECYLKRNMKTEALKCLTTLALQRNIEELANGLLLEARTKYSLVTEILKLRRLEEHTAIQNFLPNFETDWIICHGYFTFLIEGSRECVEFLGNVLTSLEEENVGAFWQVEILREFYCSMFFKYATENRSGNNFKKLNEILHKSIESFPNNVFLLTVLSKEQSLTPSTGPSWWKLQRLLLNTGRAISAVFAVAIADQYNSQSAKHFYDTITGRSYEMSVSLKNRTLSLFKRITRSEAGTRRCGLIWRLYLQFVYGNFGAKTCREVYYLAVEECPWLKALYIDAAIYIPAELPQIQDLIVEKQLRLHVTPEELDVLRT